MMERAVFCMEWSRGDESSNCNRFISLLTLGLGGVGGYTLSQGTDHTRAAWISHECHASGDISIASLIMITLLDNRMATSIATTPHPPSPRVLGGLGDIRRRR